MPQRKPWNMFVTKDKSAGWRDRQQEFIVRLTLPNGGLRTMSQPYVERTFAVEEMRELQAEAYKLLIADQDRKVGRG